MEQSNEVENIVSLIGHSLIHSLTYFYSLAVGRVAQHSFFASFFRFRVPGLPSLVLHLAVGRSVSPSVNSSNPTRPDQTATGTITFYRSK